MARTMSGRPSWKGGDDGVRAHASPAAGKDVAVAKGARVKSGLVVFSLAEAAAKKLGGHAAIGFHVVSDADMARAVEHGFSVEAVHALERSGMIDRGIGELVIKPRTLSHRKRRGQRLTVEESDRAACVARVIALAEKDACQRGEGSSLASQDPQFVRRPAADRPRPHGGGGSYRRGHPRQDHLGGGRLMRLWRLSGAD